MDESPGFGTLTCNAGEIVAISNVNFKIDWESVSYFSTGLPLRSGGLAGRDQRATRTSAHHVCNSRTVGWRGLSAACPTLRAKTPDLILNLPAFIFLPAVFLPSASFSTVTCASAIPATESVPAGRKTEGELKCRVLKTLKSLRL